MRKETGTARYSIRNVHCDTVVYSNPAERIDAAEHRLHFRHQQQQSGKLLTTTGLAIVQASFTNRHPADRAIP